MLFTNTNIGQLVLKQKWKIYNYNRIILGKNHKQKVRCLNPNLQFLGHSQTQWEFALTSKMLSSPSPPGFINVSDSEHIRGTECDQRILSKRESNGTVYSPNYPFPYPPNIVCRYFIYGLQDAQNLERVRLEFFENFDIPAEPKGDKK